MGQASVDVHPVHRHVFGGVHGCGLCVGQQFSHATVADDTSQNALSTFIGVFIFSVMALIALKNDFYDKAGVFALFVFTVFVFAMVILAFFAGWATLRAWGAWATRSEGGNSNSQCLPAAPEHALPGW